MDAAHGWWMRRFPPLYVKCFEYPEKRYINVTNNNYYKYLPFFFFVTLKGFIIRKLMWLYCSDNLQNSKTNMTKNRGKIVNHIYIFFFIIFFPYRPPLNHTHTHIYIYIYIYIYKLKIFGLKITQQITRWWVTIAPT